MLFDIEINGFKSGINSIAGHVDSFVNVRMARGSGNGKFRGYHIFIIPSLSVLVFYANLQSKPQNQVKRVR